MVRRLLRRLSPVVVVGMCSLEELPAAIVCVVGRIVAVLVTKIWFSCVRGLVVGIRIVVAFSGILVPFDVVARLPLLGTF